MLLMIKGILYTSIYYILTQSHMHSHIHYTSLYDSLFVAICHAGYVREIAVAPAIMKDADNCGRFLRQSETLR